MDTIVLDACFTIALRDSQKLSLLPQVAKKLSWNLLIPKTVFKECTVKKPHGLPIKRMVSTKTIKICYPTSNVLNKISNRYANLGKGEIEALAFATSCKEKNESVTIISDDQSACKVAKELKIPTMGTLGFFGKVYKLGLMTKKEIYEFVPTLATHMWLSQKVIHDFLKNIK